MSKEEGDKILRRKGIRLFRAVAGSGWKLVWPSGKIEVVNGQRALAERISKIAMAVK